MLVKLSETITQQQDINDIIIARDFNQEMKSPQVQQFINENKLFNIHKFINNKDSKNRESTYQHSNKYIDIIAVIS